ncbi:MAG: tetratricopeptide repeat protein [Nitrososphaerota archaeon]|nr:tetratricopeptide repeat protein [Nitrososphaerota archaeon]
MTANLHEQTAFNKHFERISESYIMGKTYYIGRFGKYKAAHIHINEQGPSNPEAIPLVGELIRTLNPVAVVMVGIAFGVDEQTQKIGDVLVSKCILPYDAEKILETSTQHKETPKDVGFQLLNAFTDHNNWNYTLNDGQTSNVFVGPILTGSKLINNYEFRAKLLTDFGKYKPIGGEMEAYGIYSICRLRGVSEWIIVKGICDWGYNKGIPDKDKHQIMAANAAVNFCYHVFNRNGVFEDLSHKTPVKRPVNNLPDPNLNFIGRNDALTKIFEIFKKVSKVTLSGGGGLGKSQLAFEYAYRHLEEYDYIWVVNASSKLDLEKDYRLFAKRVKLPLAESETFEHILDDVMRWLEGQERFLFIYDNVEGLKRELLNFLPHGHLRGHVWFNTRDAHIQLSNTCFKMENFSAFDSVVFLKKVVPTAVDDEVYAKKLGELLWNLPLALVHATAYMEQTKKNCKDYIEILESFNLPLDILDDETLSSPTYGQRTVAKTFLVSIEEIKSVGARQLFNMCAYFAPDNIPLSMFIEGRDKLPSELRDVFVLGNKVKQDGLVRELTRYSLLSLSRDDVGNDLLSVHRFVQSVIRGSLMGDNSWVSYCFDVVYSVFCYDVKDKGSYDMFLQHVSHVLRIVDYVEKILGTDDELQQKVARLYNKVGLDYDYNGQCVEALKNGYFKALNISEKILGKEHPSTATTYNNIAYVYSHQGNSKEALEWCIKSYQILFEKLGELHPNTVIVRDNIESVYVSAKFVEPFEIWLKKNIQRNTS